jgi:hypothetical protein
VRVADIGRKEFDIAPRRRVTEIGNQCRDDVECPLVERDLGLLNGGWKLWRRFVRNVSPPLVNSWLIENVIMREGRGQGEGIPVTLIIIWHHRWHERQTQTTELLLIVDSI